MNVVVCAALILLPAILLNGEKVLHREKRYLLFPFQGTFKTVFSFAIPWKLGPKQEMGVGWNFQFQYPLPYNTTAISMIQTLSRNTREKRESEEETPSDRAIFYQGVESLLDRQDINGRDCVLKTICENVDYTHFENEGGLLGQILNVFLTPTNENGPDPALDIAYFEAQKAGEFGADCTTLYPKCNMGRSFFNLFSIFGK